MRHLRLRFGKKRVPAEIIIIVYNKIYSFGTACTIVYGGTGFFRCYSYLEIRRKVNIVNEINNTE